jgi:hypothetical protein
VFARENARDGFGHALESASSAEPARSLSGNRPRSAPGRRFLRRLQGAEARAAPSNSRERSGSHAWGRASRPMCDGHSPKILLISRSRDRRNETRRPLISLGYARLKPNPVGRQRLHSTIFPFGPPRIRPRKVSHEGGSASLSVLIGLTVRLTDNRRVCETTQIGLRGLACEFSEWRGTATAGSSLP